MSLPVTNPGLMECAARQKMCREEETRLFLDLYMPHVGLGTHRMYKERKPLLGIWTQVMGRY